MDALTVKIRRTQQDSDVPLPQYMTDHAAGMDVYAAVSADEVTKG